MQAASCHTGSLSVLAKRGFLAALPLSILLLLATTTPTSADPFQEPVAITASDGPPVEGWSADVDHFRNIVVAAVQNGNLAVYTVTGGRVRNVTDIASSRTARSPADVALTPLRTSIAYTDQTDANAKSEIFLVDRVGNRIAPPQNISANSLVDSQPSVTLNYDDEPIVAWTRVVDSGASQIVLNMPRHGPAVIGFGERPSIEASRDGRLHVVYLNNEQKLVYVVIDTSGSLGVTERHVVTDQQGLDDPFHELHLCGGSDVTISYNEPGKLSFVQRIDGRLTAPTVVAEGSVDSEDEIVSPSSDCASNRLLGFAWERAGQVFYRLSEGTALSPTTPVPTAPSASSPRIAIDSRRTVVVSFIDAGQVFLTSTAVVPTAAFSTEEKIEGEAPLTVTFQDQSEGDIQRRRWDFGDGETSTATNPTHVFQVPGVFVVRLEVEGPGGTNNVVGEQTVRVLDPTNKMVLSDRRVFPGQNEVFMPLTIKHNEPLQGAQVAFSFDPEAVELVRLDLGNDTSIGRLRPELILHDITTNRSGRSVVTLGVLIDFNPPHDGRTLGPGSGQRLVNLVFNVKRALRGGAETEVRLENSVGEPPINNIFISYNQSILPHLTPGVFRIEELEFPPPRMFVRGDADASLKIDVSDSVLMLDFLFLGRGEIRCVDAADVNDDGRLNIGDPVGLLHYLFLNGAIPRAPFPDFGLDPSEDEFPDCRR